jgi:hypothetical protein
VVVHEFDGAAVVQGSEGRKDVRMTKAGFQNSDIDGGGENC